MRAGVVTVAGVVVLGVFAGGARAPARTTATVHRHCVPSGVTTVLENRWIRVFRGPGPNRGPEVDACYRATGPTIQLIVSGYGEFGSAPPALSLSGSTVGYAVDSLADAEGLAPHQETDVIVERYYRKSTPEFRRGWEMVHSVQAGKSAESRVGSLVVRPSGGVAWIDCPMKGRPSDSPGPTCKRPGHSDTVFKLDGAGSTIQTLDTGKLIDPRSLERRGNRIYWRSGGKRHSATLG